MDYEKRLKELRQNLDYAKNLKVKAEGRLDALQSQEKQYLEELKEYNVKRENLDSEITKLKSDIEKLFEEAEELMPTEILKREK